jgi:hypothetical protein
MRRATTVKTTTVTAGSTTPTPTAAGCSRAREAEHRSQRRPAMSLRRSCFPVRIAPSDDVWPDCELTVTSARSDERRARGSRRVDHRDSLTPDRPILCEPDLERLVHFVTCHNMTAWNHWVVEGFLPTEGMGGYRCSMQLVHSSKHLGAISCQLTRLQLVGSA